MIYLNNAATTFPKPEGVVEAVQKNLRSMPLDSSRGGIKSESEDVQNNCRKNLARLFNCNTPQNIIFSSGATESLNMAINGLRLKSRHVITTESEHNSVLRPLYKLVHEGGITLTIVRCSSNGMVITDDLAAQIRPDTAMMVVNHCSNVTGNVNDIATISSLCREHSILLLVDASQSAGCIPIDLQECPVDMLAFTGHKSLYGMRGIGGLYIRDGLDIQPVKVGGTGTRSDLVGMPNEMPVLLEAGTPNIPGIVSLNAGIEFIMQQGLNTIINKDGTLVHYLIEKLRNIPRVILHGNYDIEPRSPIVSFSLRNIAPGDVCFMLQESFDIIVRSGLHCAPLIHRSLGAHPEGTVRVSLSWFSTNEEIDRLIQALVQIAEMG